jgi:hypothetical protein
VAARFFHSWHQLKCGTKTMDQRDILEAFQKHGEILRKPVEPFLAGPFDNRRLTNLLESFRLVVDYTAPIEFELSKSASFATPRKQGGCAGEVHRALMWRDSKEDFIRETMSFSSKYITPAFQWPKGGVTRQKHAKIIRQRFLSGDESKEDDWEEVKDDPSIPDWALQSQYFQVYGDPRLAQWAIDELKTEPTEYDLHERRYQYETEVSGLFEKVEGSAPITLGDLVSLSKRFSRDSVRVAAVLEPLKVRLVSCGDALSYSASMPLQKGMWRFLKNKPQFQLIGKPLDSDALTWLETQEKESFGEKEPKFWVSGDYEGATDRLNIGLTKIILERFLDGTETAGFGPGSFHEICRHVLLEQKITYPKVRIEGKDVQVEEFEQKNGQLMGSTLSFPVLCVANLLCYWQTAEEYYGRSLKWHQLPVLVNGDDIAFQCSESFFELWSSNLARYGFKKSMGKNLVHDNLVVLNSQCWKRTPVGWKHLRHFSVKLLLNKKKTGLGSKKLDCVVEEPTDLGSRHNLFVKGCARPAQGSKRFIQCNRVEVEKETSVKGGQPGLVNLFIPRILGGVGFEHPSGDFRITRLQRRICAQRLALLAQPVITRRDALGVIGYTSEGGLKGVRTFLEDEFCAIPKAHDFLGPDGSSTYPNSLPGWEFLTGAPIETTSELRQFSKKDLVACLRERKLWTRAELPPRSACQKDFRLWYCGPGGSLRGPTGPPNENNSSESKTSTDIQTTCCPAPEGEAGLATVTPPEGRDRHNFERSRNSISDPPPCDTGRASTDWQECCCFSGGAGSLSVCDACVLCDRSKQPDSDVGSCAM